MAGAHKFLYGILCAPAIPRNMVGALSRKQGEETRMTTHISLVNGRVVKAGTESELRRRVTVALNPEHVVGFRGEVFLGKKCQKDYLENLEIDRAEARAVGSDEPRTQQQH